MALQRRRLLASVAGSASLVGAATVAGCIDDVPTNGGGTETPSADDPGTAPSAAEVGCPDYERRDVERVVCSSEPQEDALVFEPDPTTASLPRAEITCEFENDREEDFQSNFYGWSLHVHRDGEWWHLGPYATPDPMHVLPPGETHVRRLLVDNTDLELVRPPSPETDDGEHGAGRHGLGPGTYALAITSSSEGSSTAYAAAFTLEGEAVPLEAPGTVRETERDGDRLVVHVDSTSEEHDLDRYDLRLSRESDPLREPQPLVDEQLYHFQSAGLRAALANAEVDVEEIAVRGDDSQFTRDLTTGRGPDYVAHDGENYELQVDPHDA